MMLQAWSTGSIYTGTFSLEISARLVYFRSEIKQNYGPEYIWLYSRLSQFCNYEYAVA
jgi:hypothetical protein